MNSLMIIPSPARSHANRRRGIAMLIVLATLLVITILLGMMIRHTLATHQFHLRRAQHTQAKWLVESGLERAVAAYQADSEYGGEQWQIEASELSGNGRALVAIEVTPSEPDQAKMLVAVTATYTSDAERSSKAHKQIAIANLSLREEAGSENE